MTKAAGKERVPYEEARPALQFLQETLGIHPTHLLRRGLALYEKGQLKTVSRRLYDDLLTLKDKTEKALAAGSRLEIERLKEDVYGKRKNLILFSEVEEDLKFLQTWAGVGSKRYLGRSAGKYRRSLLKRIASWRAEKIRADCDQAISGKQKFSAPVPSGASLCSENRNSVVGPPISCSASNDCG